MLRNDEQTLKLSKPIIDLTVAVLSVSVKDRQANINRIERSFSVTAKP